MCEALASGAEKKTEPGLKIGMARTEGAKTEGRKTEKTAKAEGPTAGEARDPAKRARRERRRRTTEDCMILYVYVLKE